MYNSVGIFGSGFLAIAQNGAFWLADQSHQGPEKCQILALFCRKMHGIFTTRYFYFYFFLK